MGESFETDVSVYIIASSILKCFFFFISFSGTEWSLYAKHAELISQLASHYRDILGHNI